MINIAKAAMGLVGKQKDLNKDTAVGNVPPHSHDNSKNKNTMNPIGNITGNLNNNLKVQELGANLFQGEALAEQEMAKRNLGKPVMPPSPDPMGDQYGMQFNQPFAQRKKGKKYTTGTGMDETDLEEGNFKSSRLGTYNNQYNIENVSNIQEDKKGQFMTTISDNESWDQSPRPKSSTVDNYNYKGVRDTLRPSKGKYFKMGWGENERNISRN